MRDLLALRSVVAELFALVPNSFSTVVLSRGLDVEGAGQREGGGDVLQRRARWRAIRSW